MRSLEQLANMWADIRNPELTARGRGDVEEMNQLADAAGVQSRHGRTVQLYSPTTAAKDGVHRLLQLGIERDAQGAADM